MSRSFLSLVVALLATAPAMAAAQHPDTVLASTDASHWTPATSSAVAPLQRHVELDLRHAALRDALDELARSAGLQILYGNEVSRSSVTVSLHVAAMSVSDAIRTILQGTHLSAYVSLDGTQILVRTPFPAPDRPRFAQPSGSATISGYVLDSATGASIPRAVIRVDGTTLQTVSGADGRYFLAGVAAGEYRLTVRRVGYLARTRTLIVVDGQAAALNVLLTQPATKLDEVVTTALGAQRRYQVGNDISTINVDSIAPTAPVTSLTDLISGRAPGVTVLETSGLTGSGESIRIEGLTSLVLQNDPILIVDGVRQDNSAGGNTVATFSQGYTSHPTPTRLNDLDFSDIETIDILKGPAATTEYGTDAANGVIVITTKHGTAGTPQWKASAEQTESDVPENFPNGYYTWGHSTDGAGAAADCTLSPIFSRPALMPGTCVADSVTRWNPLDHTATSIFGTGDRGKYDLSVGGGSEAVRYYVAGGLSNELGIIRMPAVFRELADTANVGLPSVASGPNSEQQRSVLLNTAIKLGSTADLAATGSYLSTYQQTPDASGLYEGVWGGQALNTPAHYYGYGGNGEGGPGISPLGELSEVGSQGTNRVTGGLTANWRPLAWFVGHVTIGLDHGSQTSEELTYPLANANYQVTPPFLGLSGVTTDVYSLDLRGTVTASLSRDVRAVTSAGLQMVDTRDAGQSAYVQNIAATNLTLNGAAAPSVAQVGNRQATLGGYGEEALNLEDRLFVTGALRIDAASGFGYAYNVAVYPKVNVSWLVLSQGATTLRVRGAFGESGVQPMNGAAQQTYSPVLVGIAGGGSGVPATQLDWPGNPDLQPERSAEFEGGIDVAAWNNRFSFGFTGYSKTTNDALVDENLGETFANLTYEENIGEVRNTGVEGTATVGVIQSRAVTWTVAVNASMNHNVLVSLAPGVTAQSVYGFDAQYRQAVGYPLYGIWAQPVTYADANHDGLIEANEVSAGDSLKYAGPSSPTQEISVSTNLGLWRGTVTIGGLVDYRGGYRLANSVAFYGDIAANTPGTNDPTAPQWLQARAVENVAFVTNTLDDEDGSFIRIREVSATYTLPRSLLRALRVQSITLTVAVRNLALWTRYGGVDPEVSSTTIQNTSALTGSFMVNNDIREDVGAVPLARYLVARLNLGL